MSRSSGRPTGSPRWNISSFCTTTPLFHSGCSSACGVAERTVGPVRERAVLAAVPPRDDLRHLHEVVGEEPRLAHDVLQPHGRVLDSGCRGTSPRRGAASRPLWCGPQMLNSISVGFGVLARPSSPSPARGTRCCRSSPGARGRSTPSSGRRSRGSARSAMSSSVRPWSSGTTPVDVAISSSTVSKWCDVIVGHGPCRLTRRACRSCWSSV